MNRKLTLAIAAAALAAGNAFADDITVDTTPFVSSKSRAEVQAELAQPYAAGGNPWSQRYDQLAGFKSSLTRAQVTAAYIAARDQVAALNGEDGGSAYFAQGVDSQSSGTRLAAERANAPIVR